MKKKKSKSKKSITPQYGIGGLIGSGVGAVAGSFVGQPMLGAQLGGMAGGAIEGAVTDDKKQQHRMQPQTSYAPGSYGIMEMGGIIQGIAAGNDARQFVGPSHANGGIQIPNAEVEGGETMDFIEFRNGGKIIDKRKGSPYVFSKRLKVPETNTTFADTHKKLVKDKASEDQIRDLARLQEKISGRSSDGQMKYGGEMKMQTGGLYDPPLWGSKGYLPLTDNGTDSPPANKRLDGPITLGGTKWGDTPSRMRQYTPPNDFSDPLSQNIMESARRMNQEPSKPSSSSTTQQANDVSLADDNLTDPENTIETQQVNGATLTGADNPGREPLAIPESSIQSVRTPTSGGSGEMSATSSDGSKGFGWEQGLQMLPNVLNVATGLFGKDDTPAPTQVSNRSANMIDTNVNVNPQLLRNQRGYNAILADPNATMNQKLAAQAAKLQADSAVFADKQNREAQLKSNKARVQANIDSRNASFANQARTERMQSDAMFGPTGNFVRQGIAGGAQTLLQQQAMRNRKRQDDRATMAVISQLDPALQEKFIKQLGLLQ